ncbi:MAG: hypothetical protein J1F66_03940 [Clostridiales bacterium]|nr:hypothetical protein [Clostridiales bacterium]
MAIVTMKRLTLLAMSADKERIFDELARSQSVQLKRSADIDNCFSVSQSLAVEKVAEKSARVEEAIRYVTEMAEAENARQRDKSKQVAIPKNSFARPRSEVDFDYFLSFGSHAEIIDCCIDELFKLRDELSQFEAKRASFVARHDELSLLTKLPHPTTWYKNTDSAIVQLSTVPTSELERLNALVSEYETVNCEVVDDSGSMAVVVVVAHKSDSEFFEKAVALGLNKCAVECDLVPSVALENVCGHIVDTNSEIAGLRHAIACHAKEIPTWKIYVDYLELQNKKLMADGELQQTASTFVLEAFYPAEAEARVEQSIRSVTNDVVLTFDEIGEEEFAPTLIRSNKLVKPFEFVTNAYSSPDYHEIDPNPVMAVFYFIIFGLMVADIGYGLLLLAAGLFVSFAIKQSTGIKTMLQLFGICGVSAIIVGALFGSFFSYSLYPGVIPDPAGYPMVMMIISLMFGVIHIIAGIGCNMAVKIKHKQVLAAWLADFPWIIVFFAFILAIFNAALDMAAYEPYYVLKLPTVVSQIALYVCLAALAVAIVCAGLGTKGFLGKAMKSFGSAYGIINYFSDIMSYIRVFGLMLSSAIMGTVINTLAEMIMGGGGVGYVLAAIVLIFAHMFNLVMGILSVYIHNGRLQYVEFFGKFYTGDGALFTPFGSDTRYTLVK